MPADSTIASEVPPTAHPPTATAVEDVDGTPVETAMGPHVNTVLMIVTTPMIIIEGVGQSLVIVITTIVPMIELDLVRIFD